MELIKEIKGLLKVETEEKLLEACMALANHDDTIMDWLDTSSAPAVIIAWLDYKNEYAEFLDRVALLRKALPSMGLETK